MVTSVVCYVSDLSNLYHSRWLMLPTSAGMDLNELVQISTPKGHQRAFLKDLTDAFASFTKPIIAAVVGYAVSVVPSQSFVASDMKSSWVVDLRFH